MSNTQFILSYGPQEGEGAHALMRELAAIGRKQDLHFQAVDRARRNGTNPDPYISSRNSTENAYLGLMTELIAFCDARKFDDASIISRFGPQTYPYAEKDICIYNADYTTAEGWHHALHDNIGSLGKRAHILPAGVTTQEALAQAHKVSYGATKRVIIEIADHPAEPSQETKDGIELLRMTPGDAVLYMFKALQIENFVKPSAQQREQEKAKTRSGRLRWF